MPEVERLLTRDGSVTYRHRELGVTYRSLGGARAESDHVFVQGTGLPARPGPWRVLELGFGSGLNFARTLAHLDGRGLDYLSCEPDPLDPRLWLVPAAWQDPAVEQLGEVRRRLAGRWQDCQPADGYFHAYFHDPFDPRTSPDCWTTECFAWAARALTPDGVLATYGASTAARRAMSEAGLTVGVLPGAGGKREMTVASRSPAAIARARGWP